MCKTCYYAYPEKYQHIAGQKEKRLNIVFKNEDIKLYEKLMEQAELHGISHQEEAKRMIAYSEGFTKFRKKE